MAWQMVKGELEKEKKEKRKRHKINICIKNEALPLSRQPRIDGTV
jgi:hypothetical protein